MKFGRVFKRKRKITRLRMIMFGLFEVDDIMSRDVSEKLEVKCIFSNEFQDFKWSETTCT